MEQVDHALAGMDSGGAAKGPPCRHNDVEHEHLQSDLFFDPSLASFKDESFVKTMADVLSGSVDEPSRPIKPASLCLATVQDHAAGPCKQHCLRLKSLELWVISDEVLLELKNDAQQVAVEAGNLDWQAAYIAQHAGSVGWLMRRRVLTRTGMRANSASLEGVAAPLTLARLADAQPYANLKRFMVCLTVLKGKTST
eukprot:5134097-Amphidinium_carterae.6